MIPKASLNRWFEAHMADFDAVMLDIDGVLLNNRRRMPGSKRLLNLLVQGARPFILLTNDGNHSTREKADRLIGAGLAVAPEQIVSCGHAIGPAALVAPARCHAGDRDRGILPGPGQARVVAHGFVDPIRPGAA